MTTKFKLRAECAPFDAPCAVWIAPPRALALAFVTLLAIGVCERARAEDLVSLEPVVVEGIRLRDVLSFERYAEVKQRLESFGSARRSVDIGLSLSRNTQNSDDVPKLRLVRNGQAKDIQIGEGGQLHLPDLEQLLGDPTAKIEMQGRGELPKIEPGLSIHFEKLQDIPYTSITEAVSEYESVGKLFWGWASLLIPTLDCLMIETDPKSDGPAVRLTSGGAVQDLSSDVSGYVPVDLKKNFDSLSVLTAPRRMWGCKYSRWSKSRPAQ